MTPLAHWAHYCLLLLADFGVSGFSSTFCLRTLWRRGQRSTLYMQRIYHTTELQLFPWASKTLFYVNFNLVCTRELPSGLCIVQGIFPPSPAPHPRISPQGWKTLNSRGNEVWEPAGRRGNPWNWHPCSWISRSTFHSHYGDTGSIP